MSSYWPFWVGAPVLAAVVLVHWVVRRRMLAVSGRYTAIVNRLRGDDVAPQMSMKELVEAMRAATEESLGVELSNEPPPPGASIAATSSVMAAPAREHLVFMGGLVAGGFVGAWVGGTGAITWLLHSTELPRITASPTGSVLALFVGGVLVGFGTRMAGGCTSGHGLCGLSRWRHASIGATMAFFSTGVLTAYALELLT